MSTSEDIISTSEECHEYIGGGIRTKFPRTKPPGQNPPWTKSPLGQNPPGQNPPGQNPPSTFYILLTVIYFINSSK